MPKQIQRLAPLRGLNPTNVGEEAGLQGTFMRGGYNVTVIDAEWWVRHGLGLTSEPIGSVWWRWLVSSAVTEKCYLVSNNYVVQMDQRVAEPGVPDPTQFAQKYPTFFADFTIPYLRAYTMNCVFTRGSTSVTINSISAGTTTVGQIINVAGTGGQPDRIYRIVAVPSASQAVIDRAFVWNATTNAVTSQSVWDPCITPTANPGTLDSDLDGGCALFEQTATHATNVLGYANDPTDPGSFIVIVSAAGYAAVPLNNKPVVRSFLRQTQLPAPTAVQWRNLRPGVYKDRLFLQGDDPNGAGGQRTFWYSRPFDLLQWHTGLQGLGGTANFFTLVDPTDPISGFMVQGDTMIVHRRASQDIVQTYGAGFKPTHNDSGIGFWPRSMMEAIPTGHIGWSRYGPALFNSQGMTVMFPECERMLARFNQTQRMNPRLRGVLHDQDRRRVYFLLGWENVQTQTAVIDEGTKRIIRHQDASAANPQSKQPGITAATTDDWYARSPVFVVDYARNECWLEDHAGLCGGGDHLGQLYFFRYDGSVLAHPTGWSGKDADVGRTNAFTPVDAAVETQWLEFGSMQRKELQKIYLTLRTLAVSEDVDEILGGQFNPLRIDDLWDSPDDTLHLCTFEVMIDHRDEVRARADVTVAVADMLSRSLEGNRMLPSMLFTITPRAAGRAFKFRLKNALSADSQAAGFKQGHFRLVDAVVEFEVESDTRAAGVTGGTP